MMKKWMAVLLALVLLTGLVPGTLETAQAAKVQPSTTKLKLDFTGEDQVLLENLGVAEEGYSWMFMAYGREADPFFTMPTDYVPIGNEINSYRVLCFYVPDGMSYPDMIAMAYEKEFYVTIAPVVTRIPVGQTGLVENGSAQNLLSDGGAFIGGESGYIQYSVTPASQNAPGSWSGSAVATEPGTYKVWYQALALGRETNVGAAGWYSSDVGYITVTIAELTYDVTVSGGTGSGSYRKGAAVTLTANEPEEGMQFDSWTGLDGLAFTAGSPLTSTVTFTMPEHSVTAAATYAAKPTYELKVDGGTGSGAYWEGQTVTIIAGAPVESQLFDGWEGLDGMTILAGDASAATVTFSMPGYVLHVVATYTDKPLYQLEVNNGYGSGSFWEGQTVTITAFEPAESQLFTGWEGLDGVTILEGDASTPTVTFSMPGNELEVTAAYADKPTYLLEVDNGTGSGAFWEGQTVTITADAPAESRLFTGWEGLDGVTILDGDASTPTVTFSMPGNELEVTATYADKPVYVLDVVNGTGGGAYWEGQMVTITAVIPEGGWVYDGWTGLDGLSLTAGSADAETVSFLMPAHDLQVTAQLHIHEHSFAFSGSGATITATCTERGCDLPGADGGSFTIVSPEDLVADGDNKHARVEGYILGVAIPDIVYLMNGEPFTGIPCEAGDYTASITVEDAVAYVDFTLSAPAPETVQVTAQLDLVSLDDNGAPVEGFAGGDIEPLGLDRQYPINSNAPITNELPAGEYRLVLMMLPTGWEWPEDRLFTVHPDGTLTSDEMNIELRNGVWHFEAGVERKRLQIVFMNGDEVFRTTQTPYGMPFNFYGMPIPTAPAGKMWGGWYTAEGVRLNPGDVMYTDLTVYARWTDIPPRTGDNTPVALLVTLMAMSLCGAALLMRRRKVNN